VPATAGAPATFAITEVELVADTKYDAASLTVIVNVSRIVVEVAPAVVA